MRQASIVFSLSIALLWLRIRDIGQRSEGETVADCGYSWPATFNDLDLACATDDLR